MSEVTLYDLDEGISLLAAARRQSHTAVKIQAEMLADLHEQPLWIECENARMQADTAAKQLDEAIRRAAVGKFEATGDKKPHPAVSIREIVQLTYKDEDAMAYCREHLPQALTFVVREFEKVARVVQMPFVAKKTVGQATIATDLSNWIGKPMAEKANGSGQAEEKPALVRE